MAAVRIGLELLLHEQCQARESLPHVGVAGCQPNAHAGGDRNHARLRTEMIRATRPASVQPSTRTRSPLLRSISIVPKVRVAFRRRVGRTSSPEAGVAGPSATSTPPEQLARVDARCTPSLSSA